MKIQTLLARVPLWIWCVLVFAAAVGIRVHWIQQKEGFHLDEGATVVLSSYNRYGFLDAFPDGKELSGDEVRNLTCGNEFGLKNLGEDLVGLRADNRDSPHTNFYYSLFRIAIFDADSTDIKTVIARGCALNVLLFSIGFVFLALLLKKLFSSKCAILLGLAAGTLNTSAISMTLFLRPYELQTTCFIIFAYCFVLLLEKIRNRQTIFPQSTLWINGFALSAFLLSGYFSLVAAVLFGAVLFFFSWKNKAERASQISFLFSLFFLGLALVVAAFPAYFFGFVDYRGTEAAGKVLSFEGFFSNVKLTGVALILNSARYLFYPLVSILLAIAVLSIFKNRRTLKISTEQKVLSGIVLIAAIWILGIMFIAPYKDLRYIAPALPLVSLVIPLAFTLLEKKTFRKIFFVAMVLIFAFGAANLLREKTHVRKPPPLKKRIVRGLVNPAIANLNTGFYDNSFLEQHENLPAVVWGKVSSADHQLLASEYQMLPRKMKFRFFADVNDCIKNLPTRGESLLIIPTWQGVKSIPTEISLPEKTTVIDQEKIRNILVIHFSRDESAPAKMLRLNEASAKSGGDYFDVVPAN